MFLYGVIQIYVDKIGLVGDPKWVFSLMFRAKLYTPQGRNHENFLAATSAMVGRICPPWLG